MLAQYLWSGLIALLLCTVLSETFPGKRAAPTAANLVAVEWRLPALSSRPGAQDRGEACRDLAGAAETARDARCGGRP
jgi:hypothetical protein